MMKLLLFSVLYILPCLTQIPLSGDIYVHDPSGISFDSPNYYIFATGQGLNIHYSTNLSVWFDGGHVWNNNYPSWWRSLQPTGYGTAWAPDLLKYQSTYRLYYAISTFGSEVSCIGLASSPRLGNGWTDNGEVICSNNSVGYNTIDPHAFADSSGNHWLVFGSFWTGIKLVQLNPSTGMTLNNHIYSLARNTASTQDAIEASWIQYNNGYYYLYVDWGQCCKSVDSTYQIRIGRSKSVTGPYLDKSGIDLENGGGTMLIPIKQGHIIGPGHVGIYESYLTYHYYDGNNNGTPTLNLVTLSYDSSEWPQLSG